MGVWQMTTYLERGKPNDYCYEVDIAKLAKEFAKKERRQPVIVVDGTACLYEVFNFKRDDWLMGGQLRICKHNLETFVNAFKAAGIKLVFFFDGSIIEKKRHVWVTRQTEKIKKQTYIFQCLKRKQFPRKDLLPPLLGASGRFILQFELDCEVYVSVMECDEEMAVYAQENRCFAFLARDTDFVIYKGAKYFFTMRGLDIRTMKASCYDRAALIESLSLDENHLPLLASLMGNDMVPFDMLQDFFGRICNRGDVFIRLRRLADYVRTFSSSDLCRSHLPAIAAHVFGDREMAVHLQNSINMYDCKSRVRENVDWNVMGEARKRHKTCQMPPFIYPIMQGQPYELSVGIEDFSDGMEAAAKVYRPMRRRLYGVLLHNHPENIDTVQEWCVEANEISEDPMDVQLQRVPDGLHPGLLRLWTEETPLMNKKKWELFTWCISPSLNYSSLEHIDQRYIVPATALHYIVHKDRHLLSDREISALISQAIILQDMNDNQLRQLRIPVPEPRAVQVASLFGRGITTVLLLLAACGIPLKPMMPWLYYDGKLFLQEYMALSDDRQDYRPHENFQVHDRADYQSIWNFVHGK